MQKKQAAVVAIFGGLVVLLIKLVAYYLSNSVALLSDALESIVNIVASGLMVFSVVISEKPADEGHNYGHQKIEELSCMFEGLLILAAVLFIVYSAVSRLFSPVMPTDLNLAIGVSMLAAGINFGLALFLGRVSKRTGSVALEGDSKHLFSDVISSFVLWVGLFIVNITGWVFVDSILAFAVAFLIGRMGFNLVFRSGQRLMDKACKDEERKIREILLRYNYRFIDFHDMKTRRSGNLVLCELHLSVEGDLSVNEAHQLTDLLEKELSNEKPNCKLTIHVEPKKFAKNFGKKQS